MSRWAVFVDFDGTITDRDTFDVLVPIFATKAVWDETEHGLDDGTLTIREALARQAAFVRGEHAEIAALLRREVRVDPSFAPFARACVAAGLALTIVSSGVESIIRDRLAEIGLAELPVVANAVDPNPTGWQMRFRDATENGSDKVALVTAAAGHGARTIFVGDGRSDYEAASAAELRFAKIGLPLERHLTERGIPFERFATFADVEATLAARGIV